jgi:spoIIIJ-associated protein
VSKKFTLADSEPRIRQFLDLMISRAGFSLTYAVSEGETVHPDFENPDVLVRFSGQDGDLLLANKAELLQAIEQLTTEALGMAPEQHSLLCFDANYNRMLRIQELGMSAHAAAERV